MSSGWPTCVTQSRTDELCVLCDFRLDRLRLEFHSRPSWPASCLAKQPRLWPPISSQALQRLRRFFGWGLVHTGQVQPMAGVPEELPQPSTLGFTYSPP